MLLTPLFTEQEILRLDLSVKDILPVLVDLDVPY
jgi:hypothetical protein